MGIWLCSRERRKSRALHRPATGEQSVNGRERIGSDTVKNYLKYDFRNSNNGNLVVKFCIKMSGEEGGV